MTLQYRKSRTYRARTFFCLFLGIAVCAVGAPQVNVRGPTMKPVWRTPAPKPPEGAREQPGKNQPLAQDQRRAAMAASLNQMKQNADELATLARSLQEDLAKTNENILPLQVVEKATKIERLAKKIKGQAKGY